MSKKRRANRAMAMASSAEITADNPFGGASFTSSSSLYPDSQETNQRGWRPSLDKDALWFLKHSKHRAMLSDGRYIYAGSGMVSGACDKRADLAVGWSWSPIYKGRNEAFRAAATSLISDRWVNVCDVRGGVYDWRLGLRLASVCMDRDGDVFAVKTLVDGSPRIQWLEAHRIGNPIGSAVGIDVVPNTKGTEGYAGYQISAGVILDGYMRPVGYNLLPPTEGYYGTSEWNILPADSVVQFIDPQWHSQARGIPSIVRAVLDWYDLGETREAEKIGTKARSSIAIVERNSTGRAPAQPGLGGSRQLDQGIKSQVVDRGLIKYIKSTGDISAFESNKPGDAWQNFMEYVTRGAFAGMGLPYEFAWDSSKLNGTSVRAMVGQVQRSIEGRQAVIHSPALSLLRWTVAVYMNRGYLPFAEDWWNWDFSMPSKFSVDIGRDSQNRREDFSVGTRTLREIVGEDGSDVESHCRARAEDYKTAQRIADEMKVPLSAIINPAASFGDTADAAIATAAIAQGNE